MDNVKYNGWGNYPTWVTSLWHDCFEYLQEDFKDMKKHEIADYLKDFIESESPQFDPPNLYSDLLGYAIGQIDFFEIAGTILENLEESNNDN